jgi:hypothetical protein
MSIDIVVLIQLKHNKIFGKVPHSIKIKIKPLRNTLCCHKTDIYFKMVYDKLLRSALDNL